MASWRYMKFCMLSSILVNEKKNFEKDFLKEAMHSLKLLKETFFLAYLYPTAG